MKKSKNPFEIFGLSPSLVKELDDDTLFKLIKSIYKVLQLKFHPDRGGDPQKTLELNLAFELLNPKKNYEIFQKYKKAYIKRLSRKTLKNRVEEHETRLRRVEFLHELLKEKFWQYLESPLLLKESMYLELFDIVSQFNFSGRMGFRSERFIKKIWLVNQILFKKEAGGKHVKQIKSFRILGTIKREHLEPWQILERDLREEGFTLKPFLKKEIFLRECLVFLRQELDTNSYLFVYYPEERDKVYLEGVILKCKTQVKS
jgi:curved DNA-binding protein CbpA